MNTTFAKWFVAELKVDKWSLIVFLPLSADGYAFSQEEHGVVSQSQVVRSYDTTRQRPSL